MALHRAHALIIFVLSVKGVLAQSALDSDHCGLIADELSRRFCNQYVTSKISDDIYNIAATWQRTRRDTYACANLTTSCILKDMRRSASGSTCIVAAHGTPCEGQLNWGVCVRGNCLVPTHDTGMPTQNRVSFQQVNDVAAGSADLMQAPAPLPSFLPPLPSPPPPPPPPPGPPPPTGSLAITIDPNTLGVFVPPSFLGISREYGNELFWDKNLPAFASVFAELGPAPVIRIGGASQEALVNVPNATYIDGLVAMHCALGVRYIIGLPLYQNAPQLTLAVKNAFDIAFARFPKAILSYELGNEPNFWPTKEGGFTPAVNPTRCSNVTYNDPSYQLVATLQPMTGPAEKAAGTTAAVRIEKPVGEDRDRRKLLGLELDVLEASGAAANVVVPGLEAGEVETALPQAAEALTGEGNSSLAAAAGAADLQPSSGAATVGVEGGLQVLVAAAPDSISAGEASTQAETAAVGQVVDEEEEKTAAELPPPTQAGMVEVKASAAAAEATVQAADADADEALVHGSEETARRLKQAVEMPYVPTYALYRPYQRPWTPYFPQGFCFTQQVTQFRSGFAAYLEYFNKTANAITGCGGPQTAEQVAWGVPYWGPPGFSRKTISGPAWGNLKIGAQNFDSFVKNAGASCYLKEATLHWYDSDQGPNTTAFSLMDSSAAILANTSQLRDFALVARQQNVPLRVTESNTVTGGGQGAVSNVMAAALWTAEVAFEFARAGVSAVHFHWGNGGSLSGNAPAYIGVQTLFRNNDTQQPYPVVRAPFYGYMLYSRAMGNHGPGIFMNFSSSAVSAGTCGQVLRSYTLLLPAANLYSIVVLNKGQQQGCQLSISLPGNTQDGTLQRLLSGPLGLANPANGITFAGQTYEGTEDGRLRGSYTAETITASYDGVAFSSYDLYMPPASAALLQIPLGPPPSYAGTAVGRAPEAAEVGDGPQTVFAPESETLGGPGVPSVGTAVPLGPRPAAGGGSGGGGSTAAPAPVPGPRPPGTPGGAPTPIPPPATGGGGAPTPGEPRAPGAPVPIPAPGAPSTSGSGDTVPAGDQQDPVALQDFRGMSGADPAGASAAAAGERGSGGSNGAQVVPSKSSPGGKYVQIGTNAAGGPIYRFVPAEGSRSSGSSIGTVQLTASNGGSSGVGNTTPTRPISSSTRVPRYAGPWGRHLASLASKMSSKVLGSRALTQWDNYPTLPTQREAQGYYQVGQNVLNKANEVIPQAYLNASNKAAYLGVNPAVQSTPPTPTPTNLGVINPAASQVGVLTVGVLGQGGYQLQRPGYVEPATVQECPGLAKLGALQQGDDFQGHH